MRKVFSLMIVLSAIALFVFISSRQTAVSAQKGKGGGISAAYDTYCAKCHGKDGKGIESLQPPDFTDAKWQSSQTDKMITDGIRNGKGVMPGFSDTLSAAQVSAMVKHVRSFGPKVANTKKK